MPCSAPIEIGRYVFDSKHGGRIKRYFKVPCQKCIDCLKVRQQQYAFRAEWEAIDPSNLTILFCTFTYAPEFLLDNELSKLDFQRYIRRLKKALPGTRIKYMACGEYGEMYDRKHLHALLYFDKFVDYKPIADCWTFGIVDILPFLPARAGYVAKYSVKQIGSEDEKKHKVMPFLLVSNGLGFYFLEKHGDFCRKNFITYWCNLSGYPVALPRVFLERLFLPFDKLHTDKEYTSAAASSYRTFVGDIFVLKQKKRCAYDARLNLQSILADKPTYKFESDKVFGVSFRSLESFNGIMNRIHYETGRY